MIWLILFNKVAKKVDGEGMETLITELDGEKRIREIAALLSGGKVTDAALEQARNLLSG